MKATRKKILKELSNNNLSLEKISDGYWIFTYDSLDDDSLPSIYETHSVYTQYLGSMSLESWVSEGLDFLGQIEEKSNI